MIKSSFYHRFAKIEIYIGHLLNYHLTQSKLIAEKEDRAKTIDPDLIASLVEKFTASSILLALAAAIVGIAPYLIYLITKEKGS